MRLLGRTASVHTQASNEVSACWATISPCAYLVAPDILLASLDTGNHAAQSRPANKLIGPFPALSGPSPAPPSWVGPSGYSPTLPESSEFVNHLFPQACVILESFPRCYG